MYTRSSITTPFSSSRGPPEGRFAPVRHAPNRIRGVAPYPANTPLTAAAGCLAQGCIRTPAMDARTRERYPEWVAVRTERRKPRRVGAGTKVDADGLREYAILPCVHGCGAELAMLSDGKQKIQVIEDHLAECARLDAADRPAKKARGGVSVKTLADPAKAALVPMLHAKCQQDLAAVRAELTAQIDELRGTQLAMLSAFATAWPLLKQHEPLTLPSLVPTLQLVLPRAVAANATEADARVGALLQENARLKREARIVAEERDSAVDSLERITQKYNDLKRMRNIKRVTFVGGA